MIPVLAPPAPSGSASEANAGGMASAAAPGDGSEGAAFVDLLSLVIATSAAPCASASPPLNVAAPDRAESPVGVEPVRPVENEETPSLPSEDENTLVALQILMAAMTSPPPDGAVPIPPTGAASGERTEATGVARAMTDPVAAPVTLARRNQSDSPPAPETQASSHSRLEAVRAPGMPPPGGEPLATNPESQAIQATGPVRPISAETREPTPGVPLPVATNDPGGARDAVEVVSSTEPPDSLRTPTDTKTTGTALPREAAPRDDRAETAPLENLVANHRGEVTRTVLAPLYRLDDRSASGRTTPAERQDEFSSVPLSAAPSGIPLPAVERQGTPRDLARDPEESRRAPTTALPEMPRGTERVEGAVAIRVTTAARDAAIVASVRDELPQPNLERVVSAARASFARGGMEVHLQLHPESLGEVRVQVRWEGGMLSARLEAATPAARDYLESGAPALRATLQEHGIPVERLSVNLRMDSEARSQHRPPASESAVREESARDRASQAEPTRIPDPVSSGRVDIRI